MINEAQEKYKEKGFHADSTLQKITRELFLLSKSSKFRDKKFRSLKLYLTNKVSLLLRNRDPLISRYQQKKCNR